MQNILSYAIKAFLIYFFTYFATRILSNKAVAQMTSYELAGVVVLATVASQPLLTNAITKTVFGIAMLVLLIGITSKLALVNKLTPFIEHTPTVVIRNGQLDMKSLRDTSLSLNELYGLLRQNGYTKATDVEFAVLEPQGKLSVIPKSQNRPVKPSDLNIPTSYEGLTLPLIMDGSIIDRNLEHAHLTKSWLVQELEKQDVVQYKDVELAELDTQGNLRISKK
mgnify:FL=1